jgi:hypothetical protein
MEEVSEKLIQQFSLGKYPRQGQPRPCLYYSTRKNFFGWTITAEAVEKGTRRAYFRKIIVSFSPRKIIYNPL